MMARSDGRLHLRIGRLLIDAEAMAGLSRAQLASQVEAALTARLSGGPENGRRGSGGLAGRIADGVAPRILAAMGRGGHGTS